MLTSLLDKIKESADELNWTQHRSYVAESPNGSAVRRDFAESTWSNCVVAIDLSQEIPCGPDIRPDVLTTFPDAEIIAQYQLVGSLHDHVVCDLDTQGTVQDCELLPGVRVNRFSNGAVREMMAKHSFLASVFVHALVICIATFAAATHPRGTYGSGGESILVRFVAQEESVPVEETPASIDSAASAPSVAGKREQAEKVEREDKPKEQLEIPQRQSDSARVFANSDPEDPKANEEKNKKDSHETASETASGKGPINSVASTPSVASEERRILSAGGSDMEDFRSRILAAIREAIYFPKEALTRKNHGETVVRFTVNRDGSVSDLSVIEESGSTILDEAALSIIRKASKNFPVIPDRLSQDQLNYVVPIHFKEKRSKAANTGPDHER